MELGGDFFKRSSLAAAKDLLGAYLVSQSAEGKTVGRIVETESYLGEEDPASHAFGGKTKRNIVMFGPPGRLYIYFTYGMHYCLNIVTGTEGKAGAVLIRALEPIEGIGLMKRRRKTENILNLCSGPAKLTQALKIDKHLNGADTAGKEVYLLSADSYSGIYHQKMTKDDVVKTTRVGITAGKDKLWRFYIKGSPFISKA